MSSGVKLILLFVLLILVPAPISRVYFIVSFYPPSIRTYVLIVDRFALYEFCILCKRLPLQCWNLKIRLVISSCLFILCHGFYLELHYYDFMFLKTHVNDLQIDTKDILFICGGAFVDLEKTISERYIYLAELIYPHVSFCFFS